MEKFWIKYDNENAIDKSDNGKLFLVREDAELPHHYLISDGKSHVGGGKLAKKFCIRALETEMVNGREKPTIAALKTLKHGDWIFTCSMEPLQFASFDKKNPAMAVGLDERFAQYDDFTTVNGSSHSVFNCHLKIVSEKYAQWFIKNECSKLYDKAKEQAYATSQDDKVAGPLVWELYEKAIRELCKRDNIQYEGY